MFAFVFLWDDVILYFVCRPSRPMSPIPNFDEEEEAGSRANSNEDIDEDRSEEKKEKVIDLTNENCLCINDNKRMETMEGKCIEDLTSLTRKNNNEHEKNGGSKVMLVENGEIRTNGDNYDTVVSSNAKYSPKIRENVHRVASGNAINLAMGDVVDNVLPRDTSSDALSEARLTSHLTQIANVNPENCGLPLKLFTKVSSYFYALRNS